MKKLIFMLAALAGGVFCSQAATYLKLTLADGTTPCYVLSEKPTVTFPGEDMLIATPEASVTYARSDVRNMEFSDVDTGVESAVQDARSFSYIDGTITVADTDIQIYDLTGSLRMQGHDSLSVRELPTGVYIAKTPFHSVKIYIK